MTILVKSGTPDGAKNRWGTTKDTALDAEYLFYQATGKRLVLDAAAEPQTAKFGRYLLPPEWVNNAPGYDLLKNNGNTATGENAICVGFDALQVSWEDGWWCNPPFDNKVAFIQKAVEEMFKGHDGMMLLPYEPLTNWWRDNVTGYASVIYEPNGRYPFCEIDGITKKAGVNFGSALVLFTRRKLDTPRQIFKKYENRLER